jgi:hypothetical protein
MNGVENLPAYGAVMLDRAVTGVASVACDALALTFTGARVGRTLVHVGTPHAERVAHPRFSPFAVQLACMAAMGTIVGATIV